MENNWFNLMNLLERILISIEIAYHLKNKKNILNELVEEMSSKFWNLEKRNNSYNLIYTKLKELVRKKLVIIKIQLIYLKI